MPEYSRPYAWILTEGIAGTENQCIGLAEALAIPYEVKKVSLRPLWKLLTPWLSMGTRYSLTASSSAIAPPWPPVLITSGRKSIAIGKYIKKASDGKTFHIHIQDPRINPETFDIVIVPQHDRLRGPNVEVTKTSLHRVNIEKLKEAAAKYSDLAQLSSPRIAVLIGGSSKAHQMTVEDTTRLATQLKQLVSQYNATLMITASRRTGDENRSYLQQQLQGPNIRFWDGKGDNPYFGFLAEADYIIVTEDSVSMTSEALGTGKPVYIAKLTGGGRRLDQFHALLQGQGYTRPFTGTLEKWFYEPLHETERIAGIIRDKLKDR